MVLNVHKKTKTKNNNKTIRPIRDGEKGGKGGLKVGEEGDDTPIAIHCHHQNDSCIKIGSDESHFNVSLIVRNKVTRQCPQATTIFEEKGEPKRISNRGPSTY